LTRTRDGSSQEGTEWDSDAAVTTTRGASVGTSGTAQGSDAQERLLEARAVLNLPGISFFILSHSYFFIFYDKTACSRPL